MKKQEAPGFDPHKETILRVRVGSRLHGTNVDDQDDEDQMGVYVPPPEYVIGLKRHDHHIVRTQPEGVRSGPGDLDLTLYSLKKYISLAAKGNPSILTMLFAPPEHLLFSTGLGRQLIKKRNIFLSREAGERHLGYMMAQKERFLGTRGGTHTNRPELIEKYGYDTKYAGHMIRLALQGTELMNKGAITLPMPNQNREYIKLIRTGWHDKKSVEHEAEDLEEFLRKAIDDTDLPDKTDDVAVNALLVEMHEEYWDGKDHQ